jgi:hypothetical protein
VDGVGNFFASLDVSVPGKVLAAFRQMPRDFGGSFYRRMSFVVQSFLRKMVPLGYIYESKVFESEDLVYPLLTFSALPPFSPPAPTEEGVFYWDFRDDPTRASVVTSVACKNNLRAILQKFRDEIPAGVQSRYEVSDVDMITWRMSAPKMPMKREIVNLLNLFDLEYSVMRGLVRSAKFLHTFLDSNDRARQIAALANFGSEFTETFNEDLGGVYAGKSLRPLGSLLILEIAKLLDTELEKVRPTAMLETMVARPDVDFDGGGLLDGKAKFKEEDLLLHQRILAA